MDNLVLKTILAAVVLVLYAICYPFRKNTYNGVTSELVSDMQGRMLDSSDYGTRAEISSCVDNSADSIKNIDSNQK